MKILISGSTGMIGSELIASFLAQGHHVTRLVRSAGKNREPAVMWNPDAGTLNPSACEGFDAVVHLSGESIAKRWTAAQKGKIKDSRVRSTTVAANSCVRTAARAKVSWRKRVRLGKAQPDLRRARVFASSTRASASS